MKIITEIIKYACNPWSDFTINSYKIEKVYHKDIGEVIDDYFVLEPPFYNKNITEPFMTNTIHLRSLDIIDTDKKVNDDRFTLMNFNNGIYRYQVRL